VFLDEDGRHKDDGAEPAKLPVALMRGAPDLLTERGVEEFIRLARSVSREMQKRAGLPLRLIVVDTLLAAFAIPDWNNPANVSLVMNALARIARETGATVLGVHHHGKDVSRGPAGSYALTAAADCIISVLCDGDVEGNVDGRRIALTKQREGSTGWGCEFALRPHKIGTDEYGEDVVSAYVEPRETTAGARKSKRAKERRRSASSSAFLDALAAALAAHGKDGRTIDGVNRRTVSVHHVREAFASRYEPNTPPGKGEEARRKAFGRGLQEALDNGDVTEVRDGDQDSLAMNERT
jgi:AAA domain